MADDEVVVAPAVISVDIKMANEGSSESLTTLTPSKKQLNANAVEFVPGSLKSSIPSSPNAEDSTFAPGFPLMSNGYVPYYVYVPSTTEVTPSPVLTPGSFNRAAVPFQPATLFQPAPYATRPSRKGYGKGARGVVSVEPKKVEPHQPDFTKDFPSIGSASVVETPKVEEGAKPSWAAIASSSKVAPVPATVIPVVEPAAVEATPVAIQMTQCKPVDLEDSKPESVKSAVEPAHEPTPRTVPGTRLAPWARVPEEKVVPVEKVVEEVVEVVELVEDVKLAIPSNEEEAAVLTSDTTAVPEEESTPKISTMSVSLLRELRFHEECRPLAEHRAVLPPSLLRQRVACEVEDWRAEAARVGSTRRRQLDRRVSSRIEISADMLIPSENSWSVAQQKETADDNVKVDRMIFSVLNKLTVEKFGKLSDQLFTECGISKPAHIITLVKFLFEKATIQHNFIGMYADLCSKTLAWLSSPEAPEELVKSIATSPASIFRRVLLERCQETFYSFFLTPSTDEERSEEEHHKHRLQMLGTVKFVAQLLERRLMTRAVFKNCLDTLLKSDERTDDHLECACVFLTEIGNLFDEIDQPANPYTEALEEAMNTLIALEPEACARIKFGIMNLVDLRKNKWAKDVLGPSRIAEVHKQAAKEDKLARTASRQKTEEEDSWETVKAPVAAKPAWKGRARKNSYSSSQ